MNGMKNSVKNVLYMESITMQSGGVVAVNGLTLDVNEHEIVALIGPNGVGKTTVFNCVTGIYQPTFGSVSSSGEVILADTSQGEMRRLYKGDVPPTDLTPMRKTPNQITKLGIARTFQNIRPFGALTVFENALIAKHTWAKQNVFSVTLRLNHAEEKRMHQKPMTLLEMRGPAHLRDEIASSLPYGLQRRPEIVWALITSPSLLLLDEPAAGMDPQETQDLTDFIHKIRDDYHLVTFMIEHHMDPIVQISDRIYVLDFGKPIAHGMPGQIQNNLKVIGAYLGVSEDAED